MNKKDLAKLKENIQWYEFNNTGLRKINGGAVDIVNMKVAKRENKITADVILIYQMEGKTERHNSCEYKLSDFQ